MRLSFITKNQLFRNMQSEEQPVVISCASCGNSFQGKFCNKCGEKVLNDKDKSVLHFFEEFVHVLTHADSKFLKSLKLLMVKPGFLTREYLDGRRKKYASPLTMFLIANVIYLLVHGIDGLNSRYVSQMKGQPYSSNIVQATEKKKTERKWTDKEMEEHYNAKTDKVSKLLLIVLIFLFAIPVSLIFYNKKYYFFDHMIFATEFINFIIYFILLLIPYTLTGLYILSAKYLGYDGDATLNSPPFLVLLFLLLWAPLVLAGKKVYRQSWPISVIKALILTICFAFVVIIYRYILFQTTMFLL